MDGGAWWATVHGVLRVGHDSDLTHSFNDITKESRAVLLMALVLQQIVKHYFSAV